MGKAPLVLLAIVAGSLSCREAPTRDETETAVAPLDFKTGTLAGSVLWRGTAVNGLGTTSTFVYVPNVTGMYLGTDGTYSFAAIAPGSYDLSVFADGCPGNDSARLGGTTAVVSVATTTTADVDITSTAGRLSGRITVNGAALPFPQLVVSGRCGGFQNRTSDVDGNFSDFFPPGTYAADVWGDSGRVGSLSFTIVAGEISNVGVVDFQTGSLEGAVLWKGVPVSGLGTTSTYVSVPNVTGTYLGADGRYSFSAVAPGSYDLSVFADGCPGNDAARLGGSTATVSAGAVTTADVDIGATAGRVTGRITVNGASLPFPQLVMNGRCGGFQARTSDVDGNFSDFFPPGAYTADVWGDSGRVGSLSFTIVAGEISNVGVIDFQTGGLEGAVLWKGVPVAGLGTTSTYVSVPNVTGTYLGADGRYSFSAIAPGTYDISVYADGCPGNDAARLGGATATVTPASVTAADVEIATTAGRITGKITVNGTPLPFPQLVVNGRCGGFQARTSDALGSFSDFFPPGTYTADVWGDSGRVGSFTFTILAGEITDVDVGTTPVCGGVADPPCKPVDISGGIGSVGGISLDFSQVTTGGTTTVVESGAGPPPPTGFRILGISGQDPRYWDINTTATYTGPITVCIHYDETQIQGKNESALKLVHDDGTGFKDITTSLDTTANIICGTATSLSPFAVVEPLVVSADADGDGVTDASDQCPATHAGATVDPKGCSIDDLVPCAGLPGKPWKNHGAYVKAFTATTQVFVGQGLIDAATRDRVVSQAARSRCGG